jgi:hypothetical protein
MVEVSFFWRAAKFYNFQIALVIALHLMIH